MMAKNCKFPGRISDLSFMLGSSIKSLNISFIKTPNFRNVSTRSEVV